MNTKALSILFMAFLFVSFTGFSQKRDWTRLGSRAVNYKLDKDIIKVGAREGGFTKLRVGVTGGSLNMHRMVVFYMNGTKEEITLRHNFKKGSASRVIDIRGGKRLIKHIKFFYDTKNIAPTKARIHVFGKR